MPWSWGGGATPAALWPAVVLAVIFVVVLAVLALVAWRTFGASTARTRPRQPEDVLRERYIQGELGWLAYREALVNLLKDRYVRGELELGEYEARLDQLLHEQSTRVTGTRNAGDPRRSPDTPGATRFDAIADNADRRGSKA